MNLSKQFMKNLKKIHIKKLQKNYKPKIDDY